MVQVSNTCGLLMDPKFDKNTILYKAVFLHFESIFGQKRAV